MATKQLSHKKNTISLKNLILIEGGFTLLYLIFGFLIYIKPYLSEITVGILSGLFFLIYGGYNIYIGKTNNQNTLFQNSFIYGILLVILSILTFVIPLFSHNGYFYIISVLVGIYIMLLALNKGIIALNLRKQNNSWLTILIFSILILIFGIVLAINPIKSMDPIETTGVFIILTSILSLSLTFMFYNKVKEIGKIKNKKH